MADMREALEAAYEKHVEEPVGGDTPPSETGGSTTDSSQSVGDTPTETAASDAPTLADETVVEDGKSEEKPAETAKSTEKAVKPGKIGEEQKVDPGKDVKAPVSWKPNVREYWAKLPNEVKLEVQRREREIQQGLAQSADARRFGNDFFNTVRPYETLLRANNMHPLTAVNTLMGNFATLVQGAPQQKASLIAEIITNYGVDIKMLDAMLTGKAVPNANDPNEQILRRVDERIAPVTQFLTQQQQQAQQQAQAGQQMANTVVEDFITNNEFAADVRDEMADLLEASARRGRTMTIQQAYKLACDAHPDISKVIAQRSAAKAAGSDMNRKRAAASSLRPGSPNGNSDASPKDLRGAIYDAWDKVSAR